MEQTYYLISDAAKQVQVESHVLRYWEEELGLPIKRNELGHRFYTEEDIARFISIKSLKEKGYILSLATSKPEIYATRVIENKGMLPYLDHIAAASTDEKTRATKEAVIEYALQICKEKERSKILMIGDRHFDINGAKSFGLDSVGVTFGYGSEEELKAAGASHIVNSVKDLTEFLI